MDRGPLHEQGCCCGVLDVEHRAREAVVARKRAKEALEHLPVPLLVQVLVYPSAFLLLW
ncbi:hypothetical protein LR48_Vigan04g173800 [Vigna angularis]|nr:hypothetical protein LR48_Vigan04g173800 [Vigna angularis]